MYMGDSNDVLLKRSLHLGGVLEHWFHCTPYYNIYPKCTKDYIDFISMS